MATVFGVDFDGTLTDPSNDEWAAVEDQEPNPSMLDSVEDAYENGDKIIIWTARQWKDAPQIAGWLMMHEVPFHGIRCCKGGADRYIDDKILSPEGFMDGD
jgi:hydroxymethylpyrimidine pyrophosphatase-like HAD family hydrolase